MKAPKLLKNESAASFKARVKAWEKATGKKYPKTFSGKTNEERVLAGETRLTGLGIKPKDYTSEYSDEIKEFELGNIKQPNKKDQDEQAIADIKSGKVDPYTMDLPGKKQLAIDKRLAEIDAADKQRLDDARAAENKEISENLKLQDEVNPDSYGALARRFGLEVGRSDAQFTKGGGYNLTIPKNIPSDKQDQSGESKWSSTSLTKDSKLTNSTDSTSGNNSNFKSDVFTINPETGKAVGVLTRSQRRAFEKKYGDKLDKLKIRTYRNKGNTYQRYG